MKFAKFVLSFLILWCSSYLSFAAEPLVIGKANGDALVSDRFFDLVKDCEGSYTFQEVLNAQNESLKKTEKNCKVYWLRFTVRNESATDRNWFLEVQDPHIDEVFFYSNEGVKVGETGFTIPFFKRQFGHKNHVFRFPLGSGETKTFYLRMGRAGKNFGFPFRIRADHFFIDYSLREYLFLGMYYGIILIMATYNLFLFFSVRERVYLFYVFYAISCGLVSFSEDGLGFQFLWPGMPQFNWWLELLSPILLLSTFLPYSFSFLNFKSNLPRFRKYILAFYILYLFANVLHYFELISSNLRFTFYLIPFILVYYGAILSSSRGYKPARYFIVGYSLILISLAIFILRIYGLAPNNLFIIYCFNFGFVTEVVVLSLALGERLRLEKKEKENSQKLVIEQLKETQQIKDNINKDLEIKIAERTRELKDSNNSLINANTELEKTYELLRIQAEKIASMNKVLDADNQELKINVKELSKARVMFKEVNFEEFSKIYPDEEACLKYLAQIKWPKQFACRKCSNNNYSEGRSLQSRRCSKCGYEESATAFTIFHRNRLPLTKAFYMVFLVSTSKKEISSEELSRKLDIRQKSCWSFKQKIVNAINESSGKKFKVENWGSLFMSNH